MATVAFNGEVCKLRLEQSAPGHIKALWQEPEPLQGFEAELSPAGTQLRYQGLASATLLPTSGFLPLLCAATSQAATPGACKFERLRGGAWLCRGKANALPFALWLRSDGSFARLQVPRMGLTVDFKPIPIRAK